MELSLRMVRGELFVVRGAWLGTPGEGALVSAVGPAVLAQCPGKRIGVNERESQVQMPAPAFGVSEAARQLADGQRHLVHGEEIRVHSLARVEPRLLAGVRGQGLPLDGMNGSRIHKRAGDDAAS